MAIASAECVCALCGENFTYRTFRHKRIAADNFEAWGEENIDMCPACREKLNRESWVVEATDCVKLAKKMHLPPLGGTQNQIMGAEYVRVHIFESGPEEGGEDFFNFVFDACTSAKWWLAHKPARTMKDLRFLIKYSTADKALIEKWRTQQS